MKSQFPPRLLQHLHRGKDRFFRRILAILLVLVTAGTQAADIQVEIVGNDFSPPAIAIDAGDTVTWHPVGTPSSSIYDYYGQWVGPTVTNSSQTFSKTFSKPGFYPVLNTTGKLQLQSGQEAASGIGAITVLPWTNQPPDVRINWPVNGFIFCTKALPYDLVTTYRVPLTNIDRVDLLENSNVVWTATIAPFDLHIEPPTSFANVNAGTYFLQARVTDRNGTLHLSPPVRIVIEDWHVQMWLSRPQILSDGSFLCYRSSLGGFPFCVLNAAILNLSGRGGLTVLDNGVYVDARARTSQSRFYTLVPCP